MHNGKLGFGLNDAALIRWVSSYVVVDPMIFSFVSNFIRYFLFWRIHLQLHQLMPSILTCLVAKRLGNRISDNHWELRDFSAKLVALICKR